MAGLMLALLLPLAGVLGCAHANHSVGMTLLFTNKGQDYIVVKRFELDGQRGPAPGALGVGGSAQMSFMAGDSKRGVPKFVVVEWAESTPQAQAALDRIPELSGKVSAEESVNFQKLLDEAYALRHRYTRRIVLTPILTPELLAQVQANRSNTHLKLNVVFQGEDVSITAEPEVWRK